jgi:hypothetical protein
MVVVNPDCSQRRVQLQTESKPSTTKDAPTSPSVHTLSIASANRLLTATYCLKAALSKNSLVFGASGTA